MEDLAPQITRQRLLIEGYYTIGVDEDVLRSYFDVLCDSLKLNAYGEPVIHSPAGLGKSDNQGFDAFLPLIDSGISVYIWSQSEFFSIIIYTCKSFEKRYCRRNYSRFLWCHPTCLHGLLDFLKGEVLHASSSRGEAFFV